MNDFDTTAIRHRTENHSRENAMRYNKHANGAIPFAQQWEEMGITIIS